VRRGRLLNRLTIGWNALEGIVAVAAGLAAGSVSLIGFGLDSGIEVSAALILAWRLAQERGQGCTQDADRRATRAISVSFFALAAYVGVESTKLNLHATPLDQALADTVASYRTRPG
jgi:hypothetical protein